MEEIYAIYKNNTYKQFFDIESAIKSIPEIIITYILKEVYKTTTDREYPLVIPIFLNENGLPIESFGNWRIVQIEAFWGWPEINGSTNKYTIIDKNGEVGFQWFHSNIHGIINFKKWINGVSNLSYWNEYNYLLELNQLKNENNKLKSEISILKAEIEKYSTNE
jgi:hypothetical protein